MTTFRGEESSGKMLDLRFRPLYFIFLKPNSFIERALFSTGEQQRQSLDLVQVRILFWPGTT
jgi:hypothetical protein